ncbi:hypothetical protein CORC01_09358 [Colletotrichum orchidophilum]|uniref:Uncharacterized protein n=1 Tax=Colletotrichum orchidophilum TaxID=1209926 RepID=A0A1G4B1V0_9PEZI|nr:uncharacterized protein CORC01_09358 [Colletotrichum orchidophilum]OHE95347.1 hypothetical protein CORC01_09358 [Colletotrichum orchidophilum]
MLNEYPGDLCQSYRHAHLGRTRPGPVLYGRILGGDWSAPGHPSFPATGQTRGDQGTLGGSAVFRSPSHDPHRPHPDCRHANNTNSRLLRFARDMPTGIAEPKALTLHVHGLDHGVHAHPPVPDF